MATDLQKISSISKHDPEYRTGQNCVSAGHRAFESMFEQYL